MKHNHLDKPHLCPAPGCMETVDGGAFACPTCSAKLTPDEAASLASLWMKIGFDDAVERILSRLRVAAVGTTGDGMTPKLQQVFGRPRVLLPVIHYAGRPEFVRSIDVAAEHGAQGVFLINQGITSGDLLRLIPGLTQRHPSLWFGLNLLGLAASTVMLTLADMKARVGGVWCDDGGIVPASDVVEPRPPRGPRFVPSEIAKAVDAVRGRYWDGLYFGGVNHKGDGRPSPHPDDLAPLTYAARDHMDVVTTSGPATGQAANPRRVALMHAGIGNHHAACIGLASGVTPENVAEYLPHVRAFLVATGIERSFGVLDPARTRALADAIERGPVVP